MTAICERRLPRVRTTLALAAVLLLSTGCGPTPFRPGPSLDVEGADPADAAAVLFLVGDAGEARVEWTPLMHHLRAEVERWSAALPGDSSVALVYLGDNVYPVGLHEPGHPEVPRDSARLMAQVFPVSGPEAATDATPAFFLPGNHDWGSRGGPEGRARLANQGAFLERVAAAGPSVALVPGSQAEAPTVVEMGARGPRLVLLDTQWWLQSQDQGERRRLLEGLARALDGAGDRPIVVAAHHPFRSGGPHAERGLLNPLGLLARSGSVVQDLNAPPYEALLEGLEGVFTRVAQPLVYAAGHDHSLQVFQGEGAHEPRWSLVSGAASKTSSVTEIPGLVWAGMAPGYMQIVVRTDGRVELFVVRAPDAYLSCADRQGGARRACVRDGAAAFAPAFSARLR